MRKNLSKTNQQKLNQKRTGLICFLLFCSTPMWGLPWFQISLPQNDPNERSAASAPREHVNFSGNWSGLCNSQPAMDLSIEQKKDTITLKYDFMEEKYTIGALKTETASRQKGTEAGNSSVTWNEDNKALIFINTQQFINNEGRATVFFSKVSMFLNNNNLIINGEYFQSGNEPGEATRDTLTCVYYKDMSK